jgi:hypothetical protein
VVWAPAQIQPPHIRNLLNPHDDVFQHEDFDSVDNDVEVVDLNVNEPNIEGLNGIANIDYVKIIIDGRDSPTDCDPVGGISY